MILDKVLLPAPDRPVNQRVKPVFVMNDFLSSQLSLGKLLDIVSLEMYSINLINKGLATAPLALRFSTMSLLERICAVTSL